MGMEKEKLCINQVVEQKKENIEIEGDVIIPDIKPDILKCLNTCGTVCIYKREVIDGGVRIDGAININIVYLSDTENATVRGITSTIDFSKTIEVKDARTDMNMICNSKLNEIECRILNGRKINLKALVEFNLKLCQNEEIEFIQTCEGIKDIQILNRDLNLNSLVGRGITSAQAKDTILIDSIDNLSEVLKTNIDVINIETKKSYNKVLIKAELDIKIMYLTDDGRISNVESKIPVMAFVDIQDITEDDICEIHYELRNIIVKPNNVEEHSIYIEAELEFCCLAFKNREINLIEDLYSPCKDIKCEYKKINIIGKRQEISDTCNIREKQSIPEIRNEKIYDMDVECNVKKQSIINNKISTEGEISVKFIYSNSTNNGLDVKKIIVPFSQNVECDGVDQRGDIDTNIQIVNHDAIIMPDDSIELKIDLNITYNISNKAVVNIITNIDTDMDTQEERYGIIVYFAKPGDTLWSLAKKFKSTINAIVELNNIEDESRIEAGKQLFIPKYVDNKMETVNLENKRKVAEIV